MKKILLVVIAILTAPLTWAQLATLVDDFGNTVNGELMVHWGDNETPDQSVSVSVVLNGAESKVINVRRYELEVEPSTQNYFCWAVCYGPVDAGELPVWHALGQHSLPLEPGVPANNFHAYHSPMGVIGNSTYRYVWFDTNAPNDSVWVDIQFAVTSVGIEENTAEAGLTIYPNPVTTNEVMISYQLTGGITNGVVAFRNMVGQVVLTQPINSAVGKLVLPVADLPAGVYFATIEHQERIMATQRVVISN